MFVIQDYSNHIVAVKSTNHCSLSNIDELQPIRDRDIKVLCLTEMISLPVICTPM